MAASPSRSATSATSMDCAESSARPRRTPGSTPSPNGRWSPWAKAPDGLALTPGCSDLMPETLLELALDGRRIFSGRGHDLVDQVVELSLLPEPQLLEVFVGGRRENDSVRLGMELADGSIGRIPAAWTDPAKNAKLAELLADKAIISRTDTGFKAAFVKPERLRALRWEFTDFAGNEAEVKSLGIVDANGAAIVPVGSDYSDALGNDMLEVVPGDPIFVTYSDAATSGGEKRIIERNLSSSFHDGAVSFLFENFVEDRDGRPRRELDAAYRIRPGDALLIQVSDPDMDATPEADAVAVQVSAGDQPPLTLSAVEERDPGAAIRNMADLVCSGVLGEPALPRRLTVWR